MRSRMHAVALSAPLLLTGCSLALGYDEPPKNECTIAADCAGGAVCETALGVCIAPMAQRLRVVLEVTPAATAARATPNTHVFGPFDTEGPARQDLLLPMTTDVFGTVRVMGLVDPVLARVQFTELPRFAGATPFEAQTNTTAPTNGPDAAPVDYTTRVILDVPYEVDVVPLGDWKHRLPPMRHSGITIGGVDGTSRRRDFEYPAVMHELHGELVTAAGARLDGLWVRAVNAAGEHLSSLAESGVHADPPGPGRFTLYMPPAAVAVGSEPFLIQITGSVGRRTFPVILVDPSRLVQAGPGLPVQVLVPDLAPITYVGTVGTVADATGTTRIAGSTLAFASDDVLDGETGLVGSFGVTATADAAGEFSVELLPGSYEVSVVPPGSYPELAVLVETVLIAGGSVRIVGKHFELPDSIPLAGSVTTADMRSVASAAVIASPIATATLPAMTHHRSARTLTDASGLFNLPVDTGAYDLRVEPPSGSGYAWIVAPDLLVTPTSMLTADQRLEAPVPFAGVVLGPAGPVTGGELSAFALFGGPGRVRAIPIGRADIHADGSFALLLPPRL